MIKHIVTIAFVGMLGFTLSACNSVTASNSAEKTKMALDKLNQAQTTKDKAESDKLAGEAFALFEAIKSGDPNGANNFYLIGQSLLNYSYIKEAEEFLKMGIEVLPKSGLKEEDAIKTKDGLHYTLYMLYRAKQETEKSLEAIEPVKERYPQVMVQTNMELGYKLFEKGSYREAVTKLEDVVKLAHEMRRKYPMFDLQEQTENGSYYASEAYKKLGSSNDLVVEIFKLGAEAYPENYNTLARFVKAATEAKKLDGFIEQYKVYAEKDPIICLLLAKVYTQIEKKDLAKEYNEKYTKMTTKR